MPVKMIGLAELEMDMAEIVNRALTDCQTLTDDICTVIKKKLNEKPIQIVILILKQLQCLMILCCRGLRHWPF